VRKTNLSATNGLGSHFLFHVSNKTRKSTHLQMQRGSDQEEKNIKQQMGVVS